MIPVLVYKNEVEMGWFKDLEGGINCIRETCRNQGFDINEYKLVCKESKKILWNGTDDYDLCINTKKW